jgi:hypothetical protein
MDELDAMLQPLSVDELILMMTATLRESVRLGGDAEHRDLALILGRELIHRKIDPLPFMAAVLLLDVPE